MVSRAWIGQLSTCLSLESIAPGVNLERPETLSTATNPGRAQKCPGFQCLFLLNGGGEQGLLWSDKESSSVGVWPSLEAGDVWMLKCPSSWGIMELAHLGSGLALPAESFLSPPSFCSFSHPRGALSGRTSMFGPRVCGFEHH